MLLLIVAGLLANTKGVSVAVIDGGIGSANGVFELLALGSDVILFEACDKIGHSMSASVTLPGATIFKSTQWVCCPRGIGDSTISTWNT